MDYEILEDKPVYYEIPEDKPVSSSMLGPAEPSTEPSTQ